MNQATVLGLDISGSVAHACLLLPSGDYLTRSGVSGQQHSDSVLPLLSDLLQQADMDWSDLQLLALGQGPGSFTGLRIAAASMAGINAALKLPMLGMPSLEVTAMQVEHDAPLWVVEDARVGEVFAACYNQGEVLKAERCLAVDALLHEEAGADYVCSTDFTLPSDAWHRLPLHCERGEGMARWLQKHLPKVNTQGLPTWLGPVYLQPSQAERQLQHVA